MNLKKIILASASPQRKELLESLGLKFDVEPSHFEETINPTLTPQEMAESLSLAKAREVAKRHKNALIIAADTFGVIDGKIIGKPHSEAEARQMLRELSGKAHLVITGFTIIDTSSGKTKTGAIETTVYMKSLSKNEIDAYVKSGEPLDKAGSYAIQGVGAVLIEKIEGDFYNVIGLPLFALAEALKEFGVKVL